MLTKTRAAMRSAINFIALSFNSKLHLNRERLGSIYELNSDNYAIFRESVCSGSEEKPVVLVIGFRLRFIRGTPVLHWIFRRICILTTPFWSGLPGFRVKLWMVSPETNNYLGIYDWQTLKYAQAYLDYLLPILRFFSVRNSVWSEIHLGIKLDKYLKLHSAN